MKQYTYIWQFNVRADCQAQFETHYGPDGLWVALFRRAPGYIETLLLQDKSDPLRYLTIDRWQNAEAYKAFRLQFSNQYDAIDRQCQGLTEFEVPLGEYVSAETLSATRPGTPGS
jgi:heme-degrading monooxygenase HmoA